MSTPISTELAIKRIRRFAEVKGWGKTRFATEAGLSDTVLRDFDKDDWNPTLATLQKLEAIIPEDFDVAPEDDAEGGSLEQRMAS